MKRDVVIVGGGPAGTSLAMFLLEKGIKPLLVEKDEFPRYHIGESMTGECGNLVRALGLETEMQAAHHPWKQGVKVFGPGGKNEWFVPVMGRTAENELEPKGTWQVRRSVFDKMLADAARARGTEHLLGRVTSVKRSDDGAVRGLTMTTPDGMTEEIESEVVVDCSGQTTLMSRLGVASERIPGAYDKQIAIFAQVPNRITLTGNDTDRRDDHPDNTWIFYRTKDHWSWAIPLDAETVSVGVVVPAAYFQEKNESKPEFLARELRELNPKIGEILNDLTLVEEVRAIPNYSYHIKQFTGRGWMCVGDSHRFIDPVFSFGMYLAMKEAQLAAPVIADYLNGKGRELANPFQAHQDHCEAGIDIVQDVVDAFWTKPLGFALLVHGGRHTGALIDLFAGRVYGHRSAGLDELRILASKGRAMA